MKYIKENGTYFPLLQNSPKLLKKINNAKQVLRIIQIHIFDLMNVSDLPEL